jgi:voltage-gated potassium channel Kch
MEWAGLSQALGAFLAGVMLADSEYRHELELDIEPFKGLLLGLFFIAVGMSVDLGLFLRVPWLVLGIAFGIVALKLAILFPIAQLFGYCRRADAATFAVALSQAGEFAFVLFGAAGSILPAETAALLNAAVAVSMLTTPFLFKLRERLKLEQPEARAADTIRESNPVIVAGFGRFGQVVVRVLRGLGVGATVIDHDPGQIDTVRRFGWKAYYGDATRMDLLESAGARGAKLLLVAIDDAEGAMRMVKNARRYFPDLPIVVRAHSRTDAYEYSEMGVASIREMFGSALEAASRVLGALGYPEKEAESILRRFKDYDERQIVRNAPHRHDIKTLIELSEQGRRDIAELLAAETGSAPQVHQDDAGADAERGRRERSADRL